MKLNEVYSRPLKEVIAELDLSDMKIHTDEDRDVKAVELKYTDKKPGGENREIPIAWEMQCGSKVGQMNTVVRCGREEAAGWTR